MEASDSPDCPPLKAPARQPARLRRDRATTPKRRITSLPLQPRSARKEVPRAASRKCADCAHAADRVTAAGRADLVESSISQNAGSCKRRAAPREGKRNASDAGAKQSRFRRRLHRYALLLSDTMGHDPVRGGLHGDGQTAPARRAPTPRRLKGSRRLGCSFGPDSTTPARARVSCFAGERR
jgi:hypothetical protein